MVGFVDMLERRPVDQALLSRMNTTQKHRGPDGYGYHIEPGVGLGHRRLAIIDLAGGKQPVYNEDRSVVATYNGELYNFRELRSELIQRGHHFETDCDSEVIVHGWEEWGEACVKHFNGMFAFAVWDRRTRSLFLARDRLGIKPLYYAQTTNGYLLFASELKALLIHPKLPHSVSPQAVEDYFTFGYIPDPKSILTHAWKLPPGHTLLFRFGDTNLHARQYWDVPFGIGETGSFESKMHELIARMRKAVGGQLIADVPLGAFLSGGVDSSAVVAMMADVSTEAVNTCSISFGDSEYDEAAYAELVARRYKTQHRASRVEADDFELLDRLIESYDEPYADSSAIPTYRLCQLARGVVKVALSGDGGDENFAGYTRYRWHSEEERVRAFLPYLIRRFLFGVLGNLYPDIPNGPKILRAKETLLAMARGTLDGYLHTVSICSAEARKKLFTEEFHNDLQKYRSIEVFEEHAQSAPSRHPLLLIQYLDFKTYLPGDILTKVDRASMANGLEVRVPLLDHTFVEWISNLAPDIKLNGREGKFIFKRALEPYLPSEILYRRKMGFAVPLAKWFRDPLRDRVRRTLSSSVLEGSNIFDMARVRKILDQHGSGRADNSGIIWALLMFAGSYQRLTGQT